MTRTRTAKQTAGKRKQTSTCCRLGAVEGEVHLLLGVDAEEAAHSAKELLEALWPALHLQLVRLQSGRQQSTSEDNKGRIYIAYSVHFSL